MRSRFDVDPRDQRACEEILRRGSKSFRAASLLLPARVRRPTAVVYAFCRVADDAVDEASDPATGLARVRARLDAIYAGRPEGHAVDRAMAAVVARHDLPREELDALLEGFAWDVARRRYATFDALRGYCERVAATVGVLMTVLMGDRRPEVLARARDLGVAMQLTNIARDVGEDARAGRLYLPLDWLRDAGLDPDALLAASRSSPELAAVVRRLLAEADRFYASADVGIPMLPRDCQRAIRAARLIYADIGRAIARNDHDTVTHRAHTSPARKALLLTRALVRQKGSDPFCLTEKFDRAAGSYDLLTGMNPGYRRHLRASVARMALAPGARVLDLCCGTGLSTRAVLDVVPDAQVVGLDASAGMLARARRKRWPERVRFVHGDAMDPAAAGATGPFDGILMAYGLRNVPDADACLERLYALLAPDGVLCLHEYSVADSARSRAVWNAVTLGVIVPGGLITSGSTEIYRYLRRSVLAFDGVRALEARLRRHGFVDVRTLSMDGWQRGIVHSFLGRSPA